VQLHRRPATSKHKARHGGCPVQRHALMQPSAASYADRLHCCFTHHVAAYQPRLFQQLLPIFLEAVCSGRPGGIGMGARVGQDQDGWACCWLSGQVAAWVGRRPQELLSQHCTGNVGAL
jgi:hypothetical protein